MFRPANQDDCFSARRWTVDVAEKPSSTVGMHAEHGTTGPTRHLAGPQAAASVCYADTKTVPLVAGTVEKKIKRLIGVRAHEQARSAVRHTRLYSFRFNCSIVSLTAANTNRMFSVSAQRQTTDCHPPIISDSLTLHLFSNDYRSLRVQRHRVFYFYSSTRIS